ncbi:MAG: transcriptional repressor [Deltaproteobacteria bacterium]|nr:transcriptional repressor [Deltaproteobacteria bacterium]
MARKIKQIETFGNFLDSQKKRKTEQRNEVLKALVASGKHTSVDELYLGIKTKMPTIGYATVCRNLKLLCESGLAREIKIGNQKSLYEAKKDVGDHHDHLICTHCGRLEEFFNSELEDLQEKIAAEKGFSPLRHKLEIYGFCRQCQLKEHKTNERID